MRSAESLIIRPFNAVYIAVFALFILLLVLASLALRGKKERTKKAVLVTASLLTLAGFIAYKYCLWQDADYNILTAGMGGFNWFGELPLHLCNINMLLLPFAVLLDSRPLKSFCFFIGPLGALMALVMPTTGFESYSILLPRMMGYYGTHLMVIIEGIALVTFGLYRPSFRDIPKTLLTAFFVSLGVFAANLVLRFTGLHEHANYFFEIETEGNPLLELFHGWIPLPFLYQLPCYVILGVYMLIVNLGFLICGNGEGRYGRRR